MKPASTAASRIASAVLPALSKLTYSTGTPRRLASSAARSGAMPFGAPCGEPGFTRRKLLWLMPTRSLPLGASSARAAGVAGWLMAQVVDRRKRAVHASALRIIYVSIPFETEVVILARARVTGVVDAQLAAAWERDLGQESPALVGYCAAGYAALLHLADERRDIGTHEVKLVPPVFGCRMHRHFRRRQREDQPSAAHIDVAQFQHVPEKRPVRLGVRAVDDRMRTGQHSISS